MKDQDFINHINQKTTDLPIPDSISPENMKKMLDDHKETQNDVISSSKKNRYIKGIVAAACLTLCVVGGIYSGQNFREQPDSATDRQASTGMDSPAKEESLASQSSLNTPASYDEYYDTLKKAYDDYYDSISSVETDMYDIENFSYKSAQSGTMAVAEDSAMNNSKEMSIADTSAQKSSNGYSQTNTQEENVDEGDFIKTDGIYIYRVSELLDEETYETNYQLSITKTDQGNMEVLYSADLEKLLSIKGKDYVSFQEFYLQNDQLYIIYTRENYDTSPARVKTYIAICDLRDKEHPKLIQNLSQSGYYESSRISDGFLYTISNFCETSLDQKEKYENYIPSVNGEIIECSNLYYPDNILMETTYVITSLSLNAPDNFKDTKAFPSSGGNTYVSDSAIYLYHTEYNDVTQTEISRIAYKDGLLSVENSATIAGYLYDSFALSEKDGYLRIIATIPSNNITLLRDVSIKDIASGAGVTEDVNALYILDDHMQLAGKIAGIAPGERIYSARFLGDMGYFVTYKNTDPLFSVDLSDPHNPKIVGQLKIPGFSNYLHFYGDNTLLGIGEETDPDTQEFLGIKLSMFDITDPENVTEEDKYIIEDSQYSPALYDHKAIMINTTDNIFGFVYTAYDDSTGLYSYYFATYSYDPKKGFVETARYKLNQNNEFDCESTRGIYIGDYLYLSNDETITSYQLGNTHPMATVYLK